MEAESLQRVWAKWPLEAALNLPLFIPVLVIAVVIAFSFDARSAPSSEPSVEEATPVPTHAEAHAAAETAAGLSSGMLGDIRDVHNAFLVCSRRMSILSSPVEQRRCYGWGAAVTSYLNMRPDYEYRANMEPVVHQRMQALGWMVEGEPLFQPIGVGQ